MKLDQIPKYLILIYKILRLEENNVISMTIREEIDGLDEAERHAMARIEPDDSDSDSINHISVGSPLDLVTLREIEASHSDDSAFSGFRKKIIDSLTVILSEEIGEFQNISMTKDHQVIFYPTKPV